MKKKKFFKITALSFFMLVIAVAIITFITRNQEQEVMTINRIAGNIERKVVNTQADTGIIYTVLDGEKKYAQVKSLGDNDETISISSTIVIAGETYTVTKIEDNAFQDCKQLRSIQMPDTITEIGNNAFMGCNNLEGINLPKTVTRIGEYAFAYCTNLGEVGYGSSSSLETIGRCAFENCTSLRKVILPNLVTAIEEGTYAECTSLEEITATAFSRLTRIGDNAFFLCSSLKEVNLPKTVSAIGAWAFYGCSALEKIVMPTYVERGYSALPDNPDLIIGRRDDTTNIVYQIDEKDGTIFVIEKPEGTESIPERVEIDEKTYSVVSKPMIQVSILDSKNWTKEDILVEISVADIVEITSLKMNDEDLTIAEGKSQILIKSNGTYKIIATNKDDKSTTKQITITNIDKVAPIIGKISDNQVYTREVTPIIEDNESGIDRIILTKNGEEVNGYTKGQQIKEDGKYTLTVYDKVGNSKTVTFEVKLKEEEVDENKGSNNNENKNGVLTQKNNIGGKDTTTVSANSLPKAGISIAYIVVIIIGIMICILLYVKNKQYKDIR